MAYYGMMSEFESNRRKVSEEKKRELGDKFNAVEDALEFLNEYHSELERIRDEDWKKDEFHSMSFKDVQGFESALFDALSVLSKDRLKKAQSGYQEPEDEDNHPQKEKGKSPQEEEEEPPKKKAKLAEDDDEDDDEEGAVKVNFVDGVARFKYQNVDVAISRKIWREFNILAQFLNFGLFEVTTHFSGQHWCAYVMCAVIQNVSKSARNLNQKGFLDWAFETMYALIMAAQEDGYWSQTDDGGEMPEETLELIGTILAQIARKIKKSMKNGPIEKYVGKAGPDGIKSLILLVDELTNQVENSPAIDKATKVLESLF